MIRLIVDSTSDFSKEEAEALGMVFIPMRVTIGDEEFLDGVTLSKADFYRRLAAGGDLPKTSMVSVYEYEQIFDRLEAAGDQGLVVTLSEKLSGTCQAARLAAEGRKNIAVVDSGQVTVSCQILIRYALRLLERGMGLAELAAELERQKGRIQLIALVDTLEYLKKGGRISPAVALAGGLLNIKPVLAMRDGELVVLGKARGARNGGNLLNERIAAVGGVDFSMPYLLGYTGNDDSLLRSYIEGSRALWEGQADALPVTQVGCTIGTHAGPGAIAVAFFQADRG